MPEVTNILMALPAKPHHRELLESCAPNAKFTYKPPMRSPMKNLQLTMPFSVLFPLQE